MDIQQQLFQLQDKPYAAFQSKLTPTIPPDRFIGVRVPALRKLAKTLSGTPEAEAFLRQLPHQWFDENMLHGLLISEMRDYAQCMAALNAFLPYVDNWAVCDIMSPRCFKKHKSELLTAIYEWTASPLTYTCRFGFEMLMSHFLDEDFDPQLLEAAVQVHSDEYYVNMMLAWYLATALAKQWHATIPLLEQNRLTPWVHNKTIQKARESFRITAEQKAYLKTLKR